MVSGEGGHGAGAVPRRRILHGVGVGGAALFAAPLPAASAAGQPRRRPAQQRPVGQAVPVTGLHLQFGRDAAREVVVTWQSRAAVTAPRVAVSIYDDHTGGHWVAASTRSYTDPKHPGDVVYVHSARLCGLWPGTRYWYAAVHEGADPDEGSFRTAPAGRAAFTFTSFGDQGTPTLTAPTGLPAPAPAFRNDNLGSPSAGDTTAGVERIGPLFHLVNGDLCYANLSGVPLRTWSDWFETNSRSARHRPWMPTAGNHENEALGPIGFTPYQTYFTLPAHGGDPDTEGLWYSFQAGSVKIIALNNDDVCLQDVGSSYVHGYSHGAQKRWLEGELRSARQDRSVDWVVVCMHQVAMSTAKAPPFNGADIGVRREWLPLFDRYGVDLVVCGHEHHYERTLPVRGTTGSPTLTPAPSPGPTDVIATSRGTVHMVIGGGGTSAPSNRLLSEPPVCRVITSAGPDRQPSGGSTTGALVSHRTAEAAIWSSVRDKGFPYGFAAFTVDPGTQPGGRTALHVTYYRTPGFGGELQAYDTFTLTRRRTDG